MKRKLTFFLLCGVLVGEGASKAEYLTKLEACVSSLTATRGRYRKQIPAAVLEWDKKLVRMFESVEHFDSGLKLLKKSVQNDTIAKIDAHLLANSLVSCEQEQQRLARYAQSLTWFAISACFALFAFLGLALFWVFRSPSNNSLILEDRPLSQPRKRAKR